MIEGGDTPISSTSNFINGIPVNSVSLVILYANTFATLKILKELKNKGTTTRLKNDFEMELINSMMCRIIKVEKIFKIKEKLVKGFIS